MRCQLGTESHYENITKRDSMVSIIIIVDCKGFFLLLHSKCIEIQIHLFMYFFDAVSLAINLLPWAITASVSAVLSLPKLIHDQKVKARWDGNYCLHLSERVLYIPKFIHILFHHHWHDSTICRQQKVLLEVVLYHQSQQKYECNRLMKTTGW